VAWANTYAVRMDYTSTADRAGNAVINRHRAPASRLLRVLEAVPNLRAAAFRQSATEIGVEKLATLATSTTAATTLGGTPDRTIDISEVALTVLWRSLKVIKNFYQR